MTVLVAWTYQCLICGLGRNDIRRFLEIFGLFVLSLADLRGAWVLGGRSGLTEGGETDADRQKEATDLHLGSALPATVEFQYVTV